MNDKEFLIWIYDRLHIVYSERHDIDYMLKLTSIIEATDKDKCTPNTGKSRRDITR